jgi:hypothetical protein
MSVSRFFTNLLMNRLGKAVDKLVDKGETSFYQKLIYLDAWGGDPA